MLARAMTAGQVVDVIVVSPIASTATKSPVALRPASNRGAVDVRRRSNEPLSFKERLSEWADTVREQAAQLPPGPERDLMLKKARQADTASRLDEWAESPGLQPPK